MPDTLTTTDLALIRDEVGADDPSDTALRRSYLELGHWMLVALRILRRRRSAAGAGGGVSQVTVPGAIGVTLAKADLAALNAQIKDLQARYDAEQGIDDGAATASRLTRLTAR